MPAFFVRFLFQIKEFFINPADILRLLFLRHLTENTDQRLRSGKTSHYPATVLKVDLAAVQIGYVVNFIGKLRKESVFQKDFVHGILFLLIELIIPLFHIDPAAFRFDIGIDLGQFFARHGYHFHQQAGGIYAVLSMDMASYGKASGGFAADNGIRFRHLGGNVFEAYRNLIAFFPEFFRHLIQHMRGAYIADNRAVPAFIFYKVIVQQDHDIVGVKEFALIVDDSQPVRVPVRSDSDVAFAVQDEILQRTQGCRRRRGAPRRTGYRGAHGWCPPHIWR